MVVHNVTEGLHSNLLYAAATSAGTSCAASADVIADDGAIMVSIWSHVILLHLQIINAAYTTIAGATSLDDGTWNEWNQASIAAILEAMSEASSTRGSMGEIWLGSASHYHCLSSIVANDSNSLGNSIVSFAWNAAIVTKASVATDAT